MSNMTSAEKIFMETGQIDTKELKLGQKDTETIDLAM